MSLIILSNILHGNALDKCFYDINTIKSISNADFETNQFSTYAIYVTDYKLEFSFCKKHKKIYYFSIEEYATKNDECNFFIKFRDDIDIFGKNFDIVINKIQSFKGELQIIKDSKIIVNNIHLFFDEGILEGVYFLPPK